MLLLEVAQHLGHNLQVAFVHHARPDKTEVDILGAFVIAQRTNGVVGVPLGDVFVVDVGVGNHRLVDDVEVHFKLRVVFRIVVRRQRGFLARLNLCNALVRLVNEALEHALGVVHAFVNHDLDAALGDVQRLNEGLWLRDADGGLGLHLCRPVGERKRLVGRQGADVHFDDAALEDVFSAEVLEHLGLGGVDNVAEVHVALHFTFERHFHRFRNRHGRLTRGQRQGHRARVGSEGHAFRHARVAVPANDDGPVVHRQVVEHLVDDVGHGVVFALRVASCDEPKVVHELHQTRDVLLCLEVPHRRRVATRLVRSVHNGRDGGRRHHLELLRGHQPRGVLRTHNVDFGTDVRASVQDLA